MKKFMILTCCIVLGLTSLSVQAVNGPLVHTVFFKLNAEKGSQAEIDFYDAAMQLADIPGVQRLKWLNEINPKNGFEYGLLMAFENQQSYEAYIAHPDHVRFVQHIWTPQVADSTEIDYVRGMPAGVANQWDDLLDATLSKWEVWTGVPNVVNFASDIERGNPAGLSNPYSIFRANQDERGPVLEISGQVDGGLVSKKAYSDYHLTMEFKWGQRKFPPRLNDSRNSGLLFHSYGKHGHLWKAWKRSIEFEIAEGNFGNLFQFGTSSSTTKDAQNVWNPTYPTKATGGFAMRSADMEKPKGQWNRIDLYVLGDAAVYAINGKIVMALTDAKRHDGQPLREGQIQIQSAGSECFVRDLRIRPITRLPKIQ